MTEHLLDRSQISSIIQYMGRARMAQPVRPGIRRPGHRRDPGVHDPAGRPRVHPAAPGTQEQRGPAVRDGELRPPVVLPLPHRPGRGRGHVGVCVATGSEA